MSVCQPGSLGLGLVLWMAPASGSSPLPSIGAKRKPTLSGKHASEVSWAERWPRANRNAWRAIVLLFGKNCELI